MLQVFHNGVLIQNHVEIKGTTTNVGHDGDVIEINLNSWFSNTMVIQCLEMN